MKKNTQTNKQEAKNYTQALGELKCVVIPRKNDLSLELNKAVLEAF